jgi:hypothetical protein
MQFAKRPGEAFLNQIVGGHNIAGQRSGIAPQAWNMCFNLLSNIRHMESFRWLRSVPRLQNQLRLRYPRMG